MNYCKDCKHYTRNIPDPIIGQCAAVSHEPEKNRWRFQLENCQAYEYCGTLQPIHHAYFDSYIMELKAKMTFPQMSEFLGMTCDRLTKMYYSDKRKAEHESERLLSTDSR
jgi:hypothetical protein